MSLTEAEVEQWMANNPEETERLIAKLNLQRRSITTIETENLLFDIAQKLTSSLNVSRIVNYVLEAAVKLIKAEKCSLFLVDNDAQELYSIAFDVGKEKGTGENGRQFRLKIGHGIVGTVAQDKNGLNIPDVYQHPKFDASFDIKTGSRTRSMLCFPIWSGENENDSSLIGVSCLINKLDDNGGKEEPFSKKDEINFKKFLVLTGLALKNAKTFAETQLIAEENRMLYEVSQKETQKNLLLLEMARNLGEEHDTTAVVKKVMSSAIKMILADISIFYLYNEEKDSLVESDIVESAIPGVAVNPICFAIAKDVWKEKRCFSVDNVPADLRYDRAFDEKANYSTKCVLAVPAFGQDGKVLGVAVLVNKHNSDTKAVEPFTEEDQNMLTTFSIFCGLTLYKALLFDEIKLQKQKMSIVMELMSFHAHTRKEETDQYLALEKGLIVPKEELRRIDFDPHIFANDDEILVAICKNMFYSMDYDKEFKLNDFKFIEYLLTVRRNYRPVAYHNFTHATSVTHGLFYLVCNGILDDYIDHLDLFSMLLAALNHDIDHRGTNNSFQQKTGSVLANFYGTSTMERHHFNHAMTILNSPAGLNIIENLDPASYKRCLGIIEHSILATDLGLFFGTKKKVDEIVSNNAFDKTNPDHIALLRGIIMTCSDLGAMYKPFQNSRNTANSVYEEFFQQGDAELKMGLPYSSELTNRANQHEIPRMQVGFYKFVVIPAFTCLQSMLGAPVQPLLDGVYANEKEWKKLQESNLPYIHEPHEPQVERRYVIERESSVSSVLATPKFDITKTMSESPLPTRSKAPRRRSTIYVENSK